MDKPTVNSRMQTIVDEKFNGNKAAFAKAIGLAPTSMSNYLGKQRVSTPSADLLEKIVNSLGINALWLLTGEGDMNQPNNKCPRSAPDVPRIKVTLELDLTIEEIRNWGLEKKIIGMVRSNNDFVQQIVQQEPSPSQKTSK